MNPAGEDILADFDPLTIARGRAYANGGAVTNLVEGGRGVTARVQGSRRLPYEVLIPRDRRTGKIVSRALAAPGAFANAASPRGFQGTLRDYQRVGLGWLQFLAGHGLSGCLADDMGLGKTVQALALLQGLKEEAAGVGTTGGGRRRARRAATADAADSADAAQDRAGPSLVVAPVSTLRNWEAEAARFTPGLRAHVHHGADRPRDAQAFREADLVLVSYATLRNDHDLPAPRASRR